jgi:hypothetical protein
MHSILKILTITRYSRLTLALIALAVAGQLEGQVELTAPESEPEEQAGTPPSSDLTPEAPGQLRPDEGSPVAGHPITFPEFGIGRHFHLSGSFNVGYDDNVNLLPGGSPSWYLNPTANARYQFGSARLAMDLLIGGGINYYLDHPNGRDYDPISYLQFSLAYKVSPRLTIDLSTTLAYQSQPEFGAELSANRFLGNYFRTDDKVAAHYRLSPRWSSVTRYFLSAVEYENPASSIHDRLQNTFSEQMRYLWRPTTTLSGEYRVSLNEAQTAQGQSTTQSIIAGAEESFSPRLKATLRSGVQFRSSGNGDRFSPYLESSVEYELGSQGKTRTTKGVGAGSSTTYIIWTGRYSIEESDLARASGRETYRTDLRLNWAITDRISASLALLYFHGDNEPGNQISNRSLANSAGENTLDITPSIRYLITPHCSLTAGYRYTDVNRGPGSATLEPSQSITSFTRNRYYAGINLTF